MVTVFERHHKIKGKNKAKCVFIFAKSLFIMIVSLYTLIKRTDLWVTTLVFEKHKIIHCPGILLRIFRTLPLN